MFPLHNHTHYSALDGLSKPDEIAVRLKEIGATGAACTDHGLVSGHIDFFKTLTKAGLHPVLGIEAYQSAGRRTEKKFRDAFHLVLLAQNEVGLKNLWALSTEAHRTGFHYSPRADWELLAQYSEGIICTSACRGGLLQQALSPDIKDSMSESRRELLLSLPDAESVVNQYRDIYGERFYIELHTYDTDDQRQVNRELVSLARTMGVPLVYANDAHYAAFDDYELHEGAVCLGMNKKMKDTLWATPPEPHHPPCLYIMDEEDSRTRLLSHLDGKAVDEAMQNSDVIAEMCNVTIPTSRNRTPIFIPEGFKTNRDMILTLAYEGFKNKITAYPDKDQLLYWERFEYEMEVIFEANLIDYFLIVYDYVRWAKDHSVMVGPGRGSVGGSLVAYLLGITECDPIRYGLIFERFYNPGRAGSLPDIDIDFDPEGRERVKDYVVKKYGADRVADIGTVTRMGPKLAIRDIARVLSVPLNDVTQINKILDTTTDAGLVASWADIEVEVGDKLAPWVEKHPVLFKWARRFHEYVRTYGVHAAAIIVGDEPLDQVYPLRWVASQEKLVSQWDMKVAEELGYMKSDLLGLRNLKTLDEVNQQLRSKQRPEIIYDALQYQEHPDEMWSLLERGLTVGLFQVEDGGMARTICREMKPRSIEDLAVMVAMNRPGPLRAGAFEKYMHGRRGGEVEYLHPFVEKVANETFGVFLYQEQVIQFMVEIGYPLSDADEVRKMMGKKEVEKLDAEYKRYLPLALAHMDKPLANEIWRQLRDFSKYGFNKSHAIEYAIILLQCLYAKFYQPKEFILAGIKTVKKDGIGRWVEEAQRMKIEVLPPDINESEVGPALVAGRIQLGLLDVKGMGKSHSKWVVKHRPYASYDHFLEQTKRADLKYELPSGVRKILLDSGRAQKLYDIGAFDAIERREVSKSERIAIEEELLGVALSDDSAKTLDEFNDIITDICVPYAALDGVGLYNVAGTIREVRETRTKTGSPMAFVKLAYDAEQIEFAVWTEGLARFGFLLKPRTPVICCLEKTERGVHLKKAELLRTR